MSGEGNDEKRVLLGFITRPHGVRGEVLIRSYCEPPEAIGDFKPLTSSDGQRTFILKLRGASAKGLIGRIDGVTDRNGAEALKGTELHVARSLLPEPEDDEVYHDDLVGLAVRDRDGRDLGTVVGVQNFGAGDLIEARLPNSKRTEFYPLEPQFIADIDLDAGLIVIAIDESDPDDDPDHHQGKNHDQNNNDNQPR